MQTLPIDRRPFETNKASELVLFQVDWRSKYYQVSINQPNDNINFKLDFELRFANSLLHGTDNLTETENGIGRVSDRQPNYLIRKGIEKWTLGNNFVSEFLKLMKMQK